MVPPHTAHYKSISQKINKEFRFLRHKVSDRNLTDDGYATFEDFVNFLLTINIMNCDPHFISYLAQCRPCNIEYDYFIKFETLESDIEILKQKLKISDYHRKAVFPRKKMRTVSDLVWKTFQTIPNELALKLYEKYKRDFEIFGYEKPQWLC